MPPHKLFFIPTNVMEYGGYSFRESPDIEVCFQGAVNLKVVNLRMVWLFLVI